MATFFVFTACSWVFSPFLAQMYWTGKGGVAGLILSEKDIDDEI